MKTTCTNDIKEIKSNMKTIAQLLNNYQDMQTIQFKAKNVRTYDAAAENMRNSYNLIIEEMKKMINSVDMLGMSCNALDIHDYNVIEVKTLKA